MADAQHARRVADRYVLQHLLGRGGVGAVWRGHDEVLQRTVAVKEVELPATLEPSERDDLRTRVFREARAAGRLNHRNVVTVYDVVEEDGRVYIVMEHVDAPALSALVRSDGPLEPARAAEIGLGILDALRAAHREGIVHRDVKPGNVMVDRHGPVKLGDFGIAAVQDDPSVTRTGTILGSPSYMAPEQVQGRKASPQTDLWGLGATLFYALEGRPPFERDGALPTLSAVLHDEPPVPLRPGPLDEMVRALLAKDPVDRPSAGILRQRLEAVAGSARHPRPEDSDDPTLVSEVAGPPVGGGARAGAGSRRRSGGGGGRAVPVLLAVLLLAVGAAALLELVPPAGSQADRGQPAAPTGPPQRSAPPAQLPTPAPPAPSEGVGAGPEPEPTGEPDSQRDAEGGQAVPEGWVPYRDSSTGYRIAHPEGWEVLTRSSTITDFRDPQTGTYLRVDWTDEPADDPVADWQAQSQSFGSRHDGYEEIRIEPVDYRGYDSALWEYRYREGDRALHAYNLGFDTGDYGHALNFQTDEQRWDESQALFETFTQVFQPA